MKPEILMTAWTFDPVSSFITSLVLPGIVYLGVLIKKHLREWLRYAVDFCMYGLNRALKHSIAVVFVLKRYCRLRLAEESKFLHVPSRLDIKLDIDKVFVPLTLEGQDTVKATYNHETLLSVGNRLRVIGDPGSGKSSLVKRLFRDACRRAIEDPRNSKLPVLLELKTLPTPGEVSNAKLGDWFLERLREAAKVEVFRIEDLLDTYAKDAGMLVLLDGLDEVSSKIYPRIEETLKSLDTTLAKLSSNNTVVLTMRTQFHQQVKDNFRTSFGPSLFIKPFGPTDVYDFLTRWPFWQTPSKNVARIYKELTDRPTLREMCSNPLILSMYVAEDQASDHIVAPESRTEFYKKVTEELVIKRRLQQIGTTPAHVKLREQRERVLGTLAFNHMLDPQQPTNSLQWDEAIRTIKEVMRFKKDESAQEFLWEIEKETGLIADEREGQSIRFIHLTFCEFFAAFEAVQGQKQGWDRLIEAHRSFQSGKDLQSKSRLVEVIPFAAGLLPRVDRENAIDDVAEFRDNALLTRIFLETKLYEHTQWEEFVKMEKTAILATPESA